MQDCKKKFRCSENIIICALKWWFQQETVPNVQYEMVNKETQR